MSDPYVWIDPWEGRPTCDGVALQPTVITGARWESNPTNRYFYMTLEVDGVKAKPIREAFGSGPHKPKALDIIRAALKQLFAGEAKQ